MRRARTIPAGTFKARCLAILDEVEESGGEVVVTKHGRPVARVVPLEGARPGRSVRGSVLWSSEDVCDPIPETWNAEP